LTEQHVPVWFWINDDNDPQFSEIETEGLDAPGETDAADANNSYVDGTRDLIDYFPVYLDIKAILAMLGTENYSYILTTSQPRSLNVIFTDMVVENGGDYLTDTDTAHGITQLEPIVIGEAGVELPATFLDGIQAEDKGIILLEARDEKSDELVLSIRDRMQNTLMTATLPLRISSVENMINYIDLRGVITEDPPAPPVFTPAPEENIAPSELRSDKKVIFVYGYNVNVKKGRGWIAETETFKRLYWSGSRAQFYGVSWQGNDTQIYIPFIGHRTLDYHGNVINALNSAQSFLSVVQDKMGEDDITLIGHSLGNMLCAEALRINPDLVSRYFMVNGAVAIEAFDGAAEQRGEMVHPEWEEYSGVNERLWTSEWYRLFSPDNGFANDHRFRLTWRDKFSSIISKTYNFYSSGEEVFEPLLDEQRRAWTGLILQAETDGHYSWSLQELLKGRTWVNYVGSTYGGWGFNEPWKVDAQGNVIIQRLPPNQAEQLSDDQLRTKPFFRPGGDETRGLYVPDYEDDPRAIDIGNLVAQDNHKILLAGFVPSRTLATGREQILRLNEYASIEQRNYNLQDFQSNSPDNWPVERIGKKYDRNWLHNDVREVSYLYVYKLFDKFHDILEN